MNWEALGIFILGSAWTIAGVFFVMSNQKMFQNPWTGFIGILLAGPLVWIIAIGQLVRELRR